MRPDTPLAGLVLGWPGEPKDLFIDDDGTPVRIDKAFSWEHPLAVHGMMHNVITNAWRGDPYPIDTLMIYMANMAWNSTMHTSDVRRMLNDKGDDGEYRRSRSSSSATRSSRRRWRSRTSCCPIRRISSGTT